MKAMQILGLGLAGLALTACSTVPQGGKELTNKDKAIGIVKALESGDASVWEAYVSQTNYKQHNLAFPDGRQTVMEALPSLKQGGTKVEVVRAFAEGDLVVLQSQYNLFGPNAGFDVFRFSNGVAVEHWDNLSPITPANPSGHTQFDGATTVTDLDKTAANKALVAKFIDDVLVGKNPGAVASYFDGDQYIQHNSQIADGLSGLGAALGAMAKAGITMKYDQIHLLVAEGNFVFAASEGTFGGAPTAFFDLWRVENGKIAEHWDVMTTIPPRAEHKNANGKF